MSRSRAARTLITAGLFSFGAAAGCGGAQPSESDIFHDEALRAGSIAPSDDAERALLTQLDPRPPAGTVAAGGVQFTLGPVYTAASGRDCRTVLRAANERLACSLDVVGWQLVPAIVRTAEEGAPTATPAPSSGAASSEAASSEAAPSEAAPSEAAPSEAAP